MNARLDERWKLRAMSGADLDAVMEIENAAYEFPWTRGIFDDCLRVGYSGWIAENAVRGIGGYGVMSMAVGEAHILNLCVDPSLRRCGLGRELLSKLVAEAAGNGIVQMFLEVRPSNRAAMALYRAEGFVIAGRRKDYYPAPDGREDAVILVREMID